MVVSLLVVAVQHVSAQYYSWGADPARLKWMKAQTERSTVIYPLQTERIGRTTLYFNEVLKPYIGYGFTLPPLDLPFVVHPENMRSNGLVMWLPKRVEFLSSPSVDGYSMPWIKQLTAHEYRHAVQYNNLNVGVVKFLSYLMGQQSSTIGLIFMPFWMMEGDATMFETQTSSFGRGLQPRFTLEFRAMGNIVEKYRNSDTFFCGSYRDFIPDHYQFGYQMTSYGNEITGRVMANDMAAYGPRKPWMIISEGWRMKRLFGFNSNQLFKMTFKSLSEFWQQTPLPDNSSRILPAPRFTSYTTYSHPLWIDGGILALKSDLDMPQRFVALDPQTGFERTFCFTGDVSTRPVYDSHRHRVWWTEYRRSMMFAEKVTSTLCYMDLDELRPRTVNMHRNVLYPTFDDDGNMAWVEYDPCGIYTVQHSMGDGSPVVFPFGEEIHSLAWDNRSKRLYCIVTGDEGMWIASIDDKGCVERVMRPAYITISNLRAKDGKLYYGSIASGRDEIHCYDIANGREYQLTESSYGSFDVAPVGEESILMTTYDSLGFHPAEQRVDKLWREVEYARLPKNVVNPPRRKWDVINLDSVSITPADSIVAKVPRKEKRYRKGLTLFNIHSWAPLFYDPFALSENSSISFNFGATVMSQNLLSSMQGFLSYGYSQRHGHLMRSTLRYYGLGPTISLNASYGGRQNMYPIYTYNPQTHKIEFPEEPASIRRYYSVGLDVQFPMMFQRGYHTRYLIASAGWNYSNGLVANTGNLKIDADGVSNVATIGYAEGLHLTSFVLAYQDMVRQAHRDFAPPWGFTASATYAMNPANGSFSDLLALYAKLYTPGFAKHNSLNIALAYQHSIGGFQSSDAYSALTFNATRLLPRGFDSTQIENRNYMAASVNYQFPICYPDGGIRGLIYFKRLRLNLGLNVAQYQRPMFHVDGRVHNHWHRINSWGGDFTMDVNLLGSPASATMALTLSVYRPSEGGMYYSAGVALPF